ncbi:MAG TPA: hypothetical protein VIL28_02010, partial [Steroidobacteraceae bacterium]
AEVAQLEQKIRTLEAERATIDSELMDPTLYANGKASERARELMQRRADIVARLEHTESAWLEAAERLERAAAQH